MSKARRALMATELELYLYSPCNQNKNGSKYGAHADSFEQALEYAMVYESNDDTDYGVAFWDMYQRCWAEIRHDYWLRSYIHFFGDGYRFKKGWYCYIDQKDYQH